MSIVPTDGSPPSVAPAAGISTGAMSNVRHPAVVAIAAVICTVGVVVAPVTAVRTIFALPLCLYLPGYAITSAIFATSYLEYQQRVMLNIALSFATLVVGSLLLDLTPWGLRKGSWSVLLLVVILGGCAVSSRRLPPRQRGRRRWRGAGVTRFDVVLLLLAALAAVVAFGLTRTVLPAPNVVGYSDLWMLPAGSAKAPSVVIGVISDEQHPATYRVVLSAGGVNRTVDSRLELKPGLQRRFRVSLPRSSGMVTATLYKAHTAGVYRQVTAEAPGR